MKILMVYPKYPLTFWSFKYAVKFISKKASFPPLGLLTVASLLPPGFECKLVDMNVSKLRDEDMEWADMVFISAMEVQKESVKEVVRRCHSFKKKIVAGGPLFTTQPYSIKGMDHLVLDEGETTLPMFLKDLSEGNLKRIYTSKIRPDISNMPLPKWSLVDRKKYATMLLQYSRGCPFNCEFCDIAYLNGKVPRTKSPDQVIRELQNLHEMGWRGSIFFVDDNFIGNIREVKKMLPQLIEWQKEHNYPFSFLTEASVNMSQDIELLELMSGANFNKVFLGIETPNMESLKECHKYQNIGMDMVHAVRTIQKHGMEVMGGFIVGFDSDNENIFENQIEFIQRTGIVTAMVGLLNAIPETPLWERLKREGRLHGEATGSNTDGTINFIPKMDKDELMMGYRRIITTIYSYREYYKRIDTFLRNYRPTYRSKLKMVDIKAFLRSLWRIGVLSGARFHYWKLLVKTLLLRRKAIPKAIEMAIIGLHFHRVARTLEKSHPSW